MLTPGERVELWARRNDLRKQDITFAESVSHDALTEILQDRRPVPEGWGCIEPEDVRLKDWEWLWLLRRRQGWSIREMARRYGVSHVTVIKWERGRGRWGEGLRYWDGCGVEHGTD